MTIPKGKKKNDNKKNDTSCNEKYIKKRSTLNEEKAVTKLRACLSCRSVKTEMEFYQNGCNNCKYLQMNRDRHRIHDCTTENFNGFLVITIPSKSWMAKYNSLHKLSPGFYALQVVGELPESIKDLRSNY